jgi:peptidoglycan/xylan/chitin deacetylase (PgdA/CDA1 family)
MPEVNPKKALLASICARSGLNALLGSARRFVLGPHARAINYHDIAREDVGGFERQLAWFSERFVDCGPKQLDMLLAGEWPASKPGLLVTFDDGLRSQAELAAPLLEKYGFTGWFFVPTLFVDTPEDEQWAFAAEHHIDLNPDDHRGERCAMSWQDVRRLTERGHVIGSHTWHHERLRAELTPTELETEIVDSRFRLETQIGAPVRTFCWVGGEEWSYSRSAATKIREAGYQHAFMTNNLPISPRSDALQLQRTNIEAWFPLEVVAFQMNGIMDALYARSDAA